MHLFRFIELWTTRTFRPNRSILSTLGFFPKKYREKIAKNPKIDKIDKVDKIDYTFWEKILLSR